MEIKKVALVINPDKEKAVNFAKSIISWFEKSGVKVAVPSDEKKLLSVADTVIEEADMALILGGDGTVLRSVRLLSKSDIPFLTVNFGRVGFLAEISPEEVEKAIKRIAKDDFSVEKKRLLEASIAGLKERLFALNDIILTRRTGLRTLHLEVFIRNSLLYTYSCDGFVIASPTGSTAYSLSLGGPVLTPDVNAKVLIPINPHTLFNRSIVVSEDEMITIKSKESRETSVLIDGINIETSQVAEIKIGLSNRFVKIIRFERNRFVEKLKERLFKL